MPIDTLDRVGVPNGDGDKDLAAGVNAAILHANEGRPPAEWGLDELEQRFGTAHKIYSSLGNAAIAEPKALNRNRVLTTEASQPHARRQALRAESRALGGLSIGQRRQIR